jgi:hypothetical protein
MLLIAGAFAVVSWPDVQQCLTDLVIEVAPTSGDEFTA